MRLKKIETQKIETIADLFYQNQLEEGIGQLPQLIQVLNEILEEKRYTDEQQYFNLLKNITESIDDKNYIVLADLLVFELMSDIEIVV
ncbi:unknown [Clostridium sp. CAG:632]|nr:unknown [Clostridium sp. CAG:632]